MSMLVNANGRLKTYVVIDSRARTVVAAFDYAGEAVKGLKELRKTGAEDLVFHNITHQNCPDWLKEFVRSDRQYCSGRAKDLEATAAALRRKAASLVAQAEAYERTAGEWSVLSGAA